MANVKFIQFLQFLHLFINFGFFNYLFFSVKNFYYIDWL